MHHGFMRAASGSRAWSSMQLTETHKVFYPVVHLGLVVNCNGPKEEWQEFESDWSRFKRSHDVDDDVANQLFHCCVKPLKSLLIKENPNIIHEGEEALLNAMKQMAVLHVATSVRRANLLSTKQESGQTFRQFYANVRAAASTCGFSVRCPQTCCSLRQQNGQPAPHPPVDYSPMVIKDILIAGIEDQEILKDVLGMADLDAKTDKDIVKFVEEKEIARNALASSGSANALSGRPEKGPTHQLLHQLLRWRGRRHAGHL